MDNYRRKQKKHGDIIREILPLYFQKDLEKNFHGGIYVYHYINN